MGTPSAKKRKKSETPEAEFQAKLNLVTKSKDLVAAVALFDSAVASKTPRLGLHHFNAFLHICASSAASEPSLRAEALTHGLRIFSLVSSAGVTPNEASVLSAARLAAADSDPRRAFDLAKSLAAPRLRTFGPALFGFVDAGDADAAYEVERHMAAAGVEPEEPELAALLRVSSECDRGELVYEYLHKLRTAVGCVSAATAEVIEAWFVRSGCGEVRDYWSVKRCRVDPISSLCGSCGHELACVDIDDEDTDRFARSLASLATSRESKSSFAEFQEWVDQHADYEAIVDGANVGLYQQNFADGGFSVTQLEAVVKELYERSEKKWPLVVLHNKRSRALLENPSTRKTVEEWLENGILYTTPSGSNDDWYWLYATVKLKCLLVTNDEMRDHIFELLGSSFFLKWKERHHVKYTFVKGNLQLQMPPSYSSVIQESINGSWHIPVASGDNIEESERTWICVTKKHEALDSVDTYQNGDSLCCNGEQMEPCVNIASQISNIKTMSSTGKRKERSPDASLSPN